MTNHNHFNILVTSSFTEDQQEYARQLGLNPLVAPALRVEFPQNWKKIMRKVEQYPEAAWVFTSKNGVEALRRFRNSEFGIQNFSDVFAVGSKTAEALGELEITPWYPEQQDASGLARLIADHFKTKKPVILHWCGNRRRDELGNRLKEEGFDYVDMEVYQTELNPIPLPERELHAILFFSPSGVEAFRQSDGFKRPLPELFAIGNTTGEVLSLESGSNVHIPATPSTEALLELAAEILNIESRSQKSEFRNQNT